MKNIFSFIKIDRVKKEIESVQKRFPLSIPMILVLSACFLYIVHGDVDFDSMIIRTVFSLIITIFLSLGVYMMSENTKNLKPKKNILQIGPLAFGLLFFLSFSQTMEDIENMIFFFISLAGIIAFLFFAPYTKKILKHKGKVSTYYQYFYRMSVVFLKSYILGGILFILGTIAITSVFTLFDLTINEGKVIGTWSVIALSLFTPLFALTQIPKKYSGEKIEENIFFTFIVKYVALPFICIYFFILYAYSLKVLLNFSEWPKGEVSWLVIGFSVFGYITYIFSYPFQSEYKLASLFRKYFPYIVIPQIGMLFYAIYLRISQYDLTINRYFVVVFGIWLLSISLYFIFSKKKHLGYIPAVLTLFTIIISIGPWSVYNLPEGRQVSRLTENLATAGILSRDNSITPLNNINDIDPKLGGEIYDGINYICGLKNCSSIKQIFSKQYGEFEIEHKKQFEKRKIDDMNLYIDNVDYISKIEERKYSGPSKWEIVSAITDKIKVERYYAPNQGEDVYYNFSIDYGKSEHFPISVEGYKQIIRINQNGSNERSKTYANIDLLKKTLSITINEKKEDTIDIQNIFDTLKNLSDSQGKEDLSSSEMTFDISGEKIKGKLLLENISFYKDETNTERYRGYTSGYLLIK